MFWRVLLCLLVTCTAAGCGDGDQVGAGPSTTLPEPTTTIPSTTTTVANTTTTLDVTTTSAVDLCPTPAIVANLSYDHDISQDPPGSHLVAHVSGSVVLIVGSQGVETSAPGALTATLTGVMGDECVMEGSGSVGVTITGSCDGGVLTMQVTEVYYQEGSLTVTCKDGSSTTDIPSSTTVHDLTMELKDGDTVEQPFMGAMGSGTYRWTLTLP
ncbi:MAG: hypothetical protein P1T08_15815 [Acidimicrobiia bacterium]|nr:hypothetical protein [Acidimicrobiia bacterium]